MVNAHPRLECVMRWVVIVELHWVRTFFPMSGEITTLSKSSRRLNPNQGYRGTRGCQICTKLLFQSDFEKGKTRYYPNLIFSLCRSNCKCHNTVCQTLGLLHKTTKVALGTSKFLIKVAKVRLPDSDINFFAA